MHRYVVIRTLHGVVSLGIITVVIFVLTRLLGDPVVQLLPPTYTQQEYDQLASVLGYDQPILSQFGQFVAGLVQGDLGQSVTLSSPVVDILAVRLPITAMLAATAILLGYTSALLLGFVAGFSRSRWLESIVTLLATLGLAVPSFAMGIILIVVFAVMLGILPAGGWGTWSQVVLPVATLSIWMFAGTARVARSTMQENIHQEFITLARTKGLAAPTLFLRHAVRPSLPPVVSYSAVLAGTLFSGAVVTETLFSIPGLGSLAVQAVRDRDQPLVVGIVMLSAVIFILLNLLSDLLGAALDPRVQLQGGSK